MPLIKLSEPSLKVQVVTTTVFSVNPTSPPGGPPKPAVPIPAIVGGVVAGAVLAVLVTFVWIFWGKRIKKDRQEQQEEMDRNRRTKYNTLKNARISGPKIHSYRPLLRQPHDDDKRVKFVGDEKASALLSPTDNIKPDKAKHMLFDNPNTSPRLAWHSHRPSGSTGRPSPSNPLEKPSQNSFQQQLDPPSRGIGKPISHKPSNVSTRSSASGESHQGRVPSSLIFAALGNRNSSTADNRQSTSSLWSDLFRAMPGTWSSQHSNSENTYQPSERGQAFSVGMAV